MVQPVISHAKKHHQEFLDTVCQILKIPSVSTLPEHKPDILKAANWLVNHCNHIGLENVQLITTPGNPIVYADWLHAANQPTILIYGHYDVQPPDPLDEWKTPPFDPPIRGDRLYGRGTSDSKCQHFIFLAAVQSYLKTVKKLPVNVKFVIEGEEEIGSRNFEYALKKNPQQFEHDLAFIVDFGMPTLTTPAIGYGLRGIVYTEITVKGPKQDLHSGVYGGVIDNPAFVLSKILAALKDDHNRITIPGFYDDVEAISSDEKALLATYPKNPTQIQKMAGESRLISEPGRDNQEQRKTRPAIDINGMISGFTGEGAKTIIPSQASAKVSMRLVPHQDPQKILAAFKKYITTLTPPTVTVTVTAIGHGEPAVITDYKTEELQAVKQALATVFQIEPYFNRSGGSIPAAGHIQKQYNQPLAMLGFSPPDDNIHSPNENFYLPNFGKGIESAIHILQELGK